VKAEEEVEMVQQQEKQTELTVPLKRQKQVRIAGMDLGISLDARQADRVRNSKPYQYLIRPALNRLGRSNGNGHALAPDHYRAGLVAQKPQLPVQAPATPEARAIIERISGYEWYHTIQLPHGVATPGYVDHRAQLPYYHLPEDMTGMRVLDVATFDGFWAFEFERRGADVVAIDVASTADTDIPRNWTDEFQKAGLNHEKGEGFRIASEILGSKVRKEVCSVYDVSPDRLGMFDMVFCSDLLIHLRDPLRAMESIFTVTQNFAVFADVYHPELDAFKGNALVEFTHAGKTDMWWRPSVTAYELWLHLARFSRLEEKSRFKLQSNFEHEIPKVVFHAYR
jgi:tRNA (mo5U34)-methyltransferase